MTPSLFNVFSTATSGLSIFVGWLMGDEGGVGWLAGSLVGVNGARQTAAAFAEQGTLHLE